MVDNIEPLLWRLRSNPSWLRERIVREWLIPDDVKQVIAASVEEALAAIDQKSVDAILATVRKGR